MKTILLLIFFIFSAYAIAFDRSVDCRPLALEEKLVNFISYQQCPTFDEEIFKNVQAEYLANYGKLPQRSKNIRGLKLIGSQKELDLMLEMLGKKPHSSWPAVAASCRDVLCALEKLVGSKEAAMQLFNIPAKTGMILSLDQTINNNLNQQHWSPTEIREVDALMSKLPAQMRNLWIRKVERLADGLRQYNHYGDTAAFAVPGFSAIINPKLVIYDTGMKNLTIGKNAYHTISWPQEVILHELCHHHDFIGLGRRQNGISFSKKLNGEWVKISDWREVADEKGKNTWRHGKNAQFVRDYAATSPSEDYAESCMAYLLKPQLLKKISPEKYNYMKKNIYAGEEFLNRSWVTGTKIDWPKLTSLLDNDSGCTVKIAACINQTDTYLIFSAARAFRENACINKMKEDRIAEINQSLGDDPKYCEAGGPNAIAEQKDKICQKDLDKISRFLDEGQRFDFTKAVQQCEARNDFSELCILQGIKIPDGNIASEFIPGITKMLRSKIPDRMEAIGNAPLPSSGWIQNCVGLAKTIRVQKVLVNGRPDSYLKYIDEKNQGTYLGMYIYKNYENKDLNTECAKTALSAFEAQGIKTPKSGIAANIFQAHAFKEELFSFQNEVIKVMEATTKVCMISNSCKENKILELLTNWEQKNPRRRQGIANAEFAKELRLKVRN
jgi:hypothetical protein